MDILSVETLPDYPAFLQIRSALWRRGEVNGAAAMVGAGFSRFADLVTGTTPLPPLWSDLTAAMKDELCLNDDTTSDPLTLAEEYRVELGTIALENLIRSQVRNDELNPGNFHRRLLSLPWADVLTTNWDTLLERSVEDNPDLPYDVVLTSSDIPLKRSPRIVKLHGSLPSHGPFILTREDFRTYPTRFAPFANLARQVLLENELCLIGFSGDDPNFLEWSGWVRDQLGDAARPIRLLGNLGVSNSRRRLLNSRNVTPIDLYPLVKDVPAKEQHRRATEIIIKFFEDGKPRKTKWNFSSAGENVKNSSDSDSTLTNLTKAWATERKNHPGWLVTPSSVRTELWNASNSCIDVLEKNLKAATKSVKAAILYEAIWRWETAFWPLPEFIACAASNLVAAGEDNSLSLKQQTFLRTAIVRDSRHRRDWSTFEVGIHSLEQLNDPDATLEAIYERCLKAQDEFEYEFVATHVDQITGTDPIWLLRRAALEVDVMDSREVIKLIHEAYRQIRRQRAQSPRSIWLISREAWALWLARLARFESELSALDEQRDWPHAYRDYETDPWDEIQKIEHQITWEEQQGLGNLCTRQPKFDAGAYRLTFRGRINPVHRPHNDLIRIMECVGIPFRFTYVDLFGSRFARALRTLEQSGTVDAFERVRGAIATDVKSVENHFSRVSVARLPLTDVNVCVQNIKRGIEFGKRKIMRLPSDQAKNECLFWTNRVCEMIELLSRLSMRLQGNDALNIVRFGTAVSRELITDCPRIFERLENLVFRGLHAVEPSQHQKIALDILQLPLHSELGSSFSSTSNWFKVIAAINQDAWRVRNESSEGLEKAKWSARISFLISVANDCPHKQSRQDALHRLARLFDAGVLTKDEIQGFQNSIWKRNTINGLPSSTGLLPHVFLRMPSSSPTRVKNAFNANVVSELADGSFEADLLQALCSASFSLNGAYKCYKIRSTHAIRIIDHALSWRPDEQVHAAGFVWPNQSGEWILHLIGRALAATVIPSLSASKLGVRRTYKLLGRAPEQSSPTFLEALPALATLDTALTDEVVGAIQRGLISANRDVVASALNAVFWFEIFASHNDDIRIPDTLVSEVVSMCLMRREPGLIFALQCVRQLVMATAVSESDCFKLVHALSLVRVDTDYENWRDENRSSDVGLIRKEAVKLATTLCDSGISDQRLDEWIMEARSDPMPEVRYALSIGDAL